MVDPQSIQSARLSVQSSGLGPPTLSPASDCCTPLWVQGGKHTDKLVVYQNSPINAYMYFFIKHWEFIQSLQLRLIISRNILDAMMLILIETMEIPPGNGCQTEFFNAFLNKYFLYKYIILLLTTF
jgi:hypothetical protein